MTGWISLITAFLKAVTAYCEYKVTALPLQQSESAHQLADETEDEIDRLRDLGTPAATDRADRLRQRYARRRKFAETLSTLNPSASQRPGNPNG